MNSSSTKTLDQSSVTSTTSTPQSPELTHLPAHQRRFLLEHGSCPMCETELKISHEIDKNEQKVKEVAYCSQCQLRARSGSYNLH